jgi:uncharacterized membrane protein SirB2
MYLFLKYVHLAFAVTTISGFVLRGFWMLTESERLSQRATRIAPHVIDALFLLTGIAMVYLLSLPVLQTPWLLAKLIALLAYIILGAVALRRGPTLQIRLIAFVGALSAFAYVVGAALSKSPLSWLAYLAR